MSTNSFVFPKFSKQNYYVESWYPVLADLTFKSWIFRFTQEEGDLLHRIVFDTIHNKPIIKKDQESLNHFISKVSNFFEKVKNESPPNSGFFLRLGSRSLKDAVFYSKTSLKRVTNLLYEKYLNEYKSLNLVTKDEKIKWVNQKSQMKDYFYMTECHIKALKCNSIPDMFDLFFHSERIMIDLFRENKYQSPMFSLNFRLWDDRLTYQMEFRGFIYHHKFCALTQYDNCLYFKHVYENKEKILHSITDLYENKVRPRMEANCPMIEGNYVIDFGVIFNGTNVVDVIVIELNNFQMTTGASLFDWNKDIEILIGKKNFEFRLIKENKFSENDYDNLLGPELIMLKNQVKAQIINDNKTFSEKYFKWIKKVVPEKA